MCPLTTHLPDQGVSPPPSLLTKGALSVHSPIYCQICIAFIHTVLLGSDLLLICYNVVKQIRKSYLLVFRLKSQYRVIYSWSFLFLLYQISVNKYNTKASTIDQRKVKVLMKHQGCRIPSRVPFRKKNRTSRALFLTKLPQNIYQ